MEVNNIGLPRDLMVDILSRLPAKILCKFRCVSKQWLNLISSSDPHFVNLHRHRSKRNPLLLIPDISLDGNDQYALRLVSSDIEGRLHNQFTKIIVSPLVSYDSCCNLMCLVCFFLVYVCYPSTREILSLPSSSHFLDNYGTAFGYLPSSNKYKIVQLFRRSRSWSRGFYEFEIGCEIFTITEGGPNSGSWRVIANCPYSFLDSKSHVWVNGAIYWIITGRKYDPKNLGIVSFDLEKEEFGIVLYPKCYSDPFPDYASLLDLKGSLCLVDRLFKTPTIDIWMLKDHTNHIWVKEYTINLFFNRDIKILGYLPSDDHDGEILIKPDQEGLLCCSIENNRFRRAEVENLNIPQYYLPCLYIDGLFSLGSR